MRFEVSIKIPVAMTTQQYGTYGLQCAAVKTMSGPCMVVKKAVASEFGSFDERIETNIHQRITYN